MAVSPDEDMAAGSWDVERLGCTGRLRVEAQGRRRYHLFFLGGDTKPFSPPQQSQP